MTEHWGGWELDTANYTLRLVRYEVDLETCTSSAEVLDWVVQVAGKSWATPKVLSGLIHALNDVLALQANLCGDGRSKRLSVPVIRRLVGTYEP